jgi:hypothetical protein
MLVIRAYNLKRIPKILAICNLKISHLNQYMSLENYYFHKYLTTTKSIKVFWYTIGRGDALNSMSPWSKVAISNSFVVMVI